MAATRTDRRDLRKFNFVRLHGVMFGLIYPAFLGAFAVAIFLKEAPGSTVWLAVLLCIYFVIQFAEGVSKFANYSLDAAGLHTAEVVLMCILFFGIGYFDSRSSASVRLQPVAISVILMTAILLPPARRLHLYFDESFKSGAPLRRFYVRVTVVAITSGLVAVFWWSFCSKAFLSISLGYYLYQTVMAKDTEAID